VRVPPGLLASTGAEEPLDLYRMLRFPEEAYRNSRTIYYSSVVEWRDVLSVDDGRKVTQIKVLSPHHDEEYLFTLQDPVTTVTSQGLTRR
jgi:hypothetical protein